LIGAIKAARDASALICELGAQRSALAERDMLLSADMRAALCARRRREAQAGGAMEEE